MEKRHSYKLIKSAILNCNELFVQFLIWIRLVFTFRTSNDKVCLFGIKTMALFGVRLMRLTLYILAALTRANSSGLSASKIGSPFSVLDCVLASTLGDSSWIRLL